MAKHDRAFLIILEVASICLMLLPSSWTAAHSSSNMSKRTDLIEDENGEVFPVLWVKRAKRASQNANGIYRVTKRGADGLFTDWAKRGTDRRFFTDWAKLKQGVTLWDDNLMRVI